MLTPKQIAELLYVMPHTLAVLCCTGRYDLLFVKTGRLVRYKTDDVQAFINKHTQNNFVDFDAIGEVRA